MTVLSSGDAHRDMMCMCEFIYKSKCVCVCVMSVFVYIVFPKKNSSLLMRCTSVKLGGIRYYSANCFNSFS